jgi:preprotein translocase subunit YajC
MLISPAFAQTTAAAADGGSAALFAQIAPLVLIFGVFYFLLIRPQQRKMKEHKAKLDAVKKGDQVVTGGGLVGKVVRVDDIYVDVELGQGMKVKAVKATLSDVLTPNAQPAND